MGPMIGIALLVGTAVALSLLWLGGFGVVVVGPLGLEGLMGFDPAGLAALAAVGVLPVAGIWAVAFFLGTLLALRRQAVAMRQVLWQAKRTGDHTETIMRALIEARHQAQHQAYLALAPQALDDLNSVLARLAERTGLCPAADAAALWARYGQGDRAVFCHAFAEAAERNPRLAAALGRAAARTPSLNAEIAGFMTRYDRLVRLGGEHDEQHLLLDLIQDGGLAAVRALFARASHLGAEDLDDEAAAPEAEAKSDSPPTDEPAPESRPRRRRNLFAAMASHAQTPAAVPEPGADGEEMAPEAAGDDPRGDRAPPPSLRTFSPLTPGFPRHKRLPNETDDT